jgi:hypothetical protein
MMPDAALDAVDEPTRRLRGTPSRWWVAYWSRLRLPALIAGLMLGLWAIGLFLGLEFLPIGLGKWRHGPGLADHLLAWDGLWYFDIARHGYVWNPAVGRLPRHFENPAFYPLYPLMERAMMDITGSAASALIVLPGIIFGVAAVFAFHRLALRLLPARGAKYATMFYALWPASVYCMMGYPTGLISLFVIGAFGAYIEGRFWRAALWCGIAAAATPTMQFIAFALCLDQGMGWLRRRAPAREIPRLIGFGLLSVSGLLAFVAYQAIVLHDPLVFLKAQDAWGLPPPLRERLWRLINPLWYLKELHQEAWKWESIYKNWGRPSLDMHEVLRVFVSTEQWTLNLISLTLAAIGVLAAFRYVRVRALPLAGLIGLIGYLWFIATTDQNLASTPRLIYPALMLFAGLGALLSRSRLAVFGVAGLLSLLTVLNAAFGVANYYFI